jgi:hypothetical protein
MGLTSYQAAPPRNRFFNVNEDTVTESLRLSTRNIIFFRKSLEIEGHLPRIHPRRSFFGERSLAHRLRHHLTVAHPAP